MKTNLYLLVLLASITSLSVCGQTKISGVLQRTNGETIPGANITVANTYDGTSTDTAGKFSFTTFETGKQLLRYTAVGYKKDSLWVELAGKPLVLDLKLKEAVNELNAVTISAGTLETGDSKKGAVLTSLDVATTAGAVADIVAALQTLPGTAQAFGENGLFVRGGSSAETRTYFDGMLVKNPFGSQLPDMASRSRFSPFLFKGTTFSSGGYSAQYGQALSSALLLESKDLPEKTSTEFNLMSVGGGVAHTERMKNSALVVGGYYYNLQPAYSFFKQNTNWDKTPEQMQGMLQYKMKPTKNGMLKVYTEYSNADVALFTDNLDAGSLTHVVNHNKNYYLNTSYQDYLSEDWKVQVGLSYSRTRESGDINTDNYRRNDDLLQGRLTVSRYIGQRSVLRAGGEAYRSNSLEGWNNLSRDYTDNLQAGFTEGEIYLGDAIVARLGLRAEHSSYLGEWNLAPRTSLAFKTGKRTQVSMAYGVFYQNPDDTYLLQNKNLGYERARHYLINYQYLTNSHTFRVEAFYKEYAQLTKYDFQGITKSYSVNNYSNLYNGGNGYARGIEVFWRDKTTIKGGDYWVSYSFLDTKRDFRDYPVQATPPFAAKHTLNVVYKQYIPFITSEVGTTYSYSSGRTYYNPNTTSFLADKTKSFNNLSFNVSYLTKVFNQFTVVYASVSNLTGFNNIYGYNYASNGQSRQPIIPASKRNYFLGIFITIGDNTFNH
jgi:hypothetical protein